jgi:nucleoid DNA-binding protein
MISKPIKMLLSDVCRVVAKRLRVQQKATREIVTNFCDEIVNQLCANKRIVIKNFGVFSVRSTPARKAPQLPNDTTIRFSPAHQMPRFRFSKKVSRKINESY